MLMARQDIGYIPCLGNTDTALYRAIQFSSTIANELVGEIIWSAAFGDPSLFPSYEVFWTGIAFIVVTVDFYELK
jgi:hypothetical protein